MYTVAESPSAKAEMMTENGRSRRFGRRIIFTFGRSRIIAEYAQLPTFGSQAEAELRSTTNCMRLRQNSRRTQVLNLWKYNWMNLKNLFTITQFMHRVCPFGCTRAHHLHCQYAPCLKKVPTYLLLWVCQIWTDFNWTLVGMYRNKLSTKMYRYIVR